MPKKIQTENQLLRYLSNTPLQVEIKLLQTESYRSTHTSLEHMEKFYSFFNDIKDERFDGLVITGAPVEQLEFEDVMYWEELKEIMEWEILSESEEAGIFIVANKNRRQVFITGHLEYERNTLSDEYFRDFNKGLDIEIPRNYFPNDNTSLTPMVTWRGSANIVFSNWLNYCVYQNTPYDLEKL